MKPHFIPSTPTWAPSSPNFAHSLFRQAPYSQYFSLSGSPGSLASVTFPHPSPELLTPHLPLFAGKGKKKHSSLHGLLGACPDPLAREEGLGTDGAGRGPKMPGMQRKPLEGGGPCLPNARHGVLPAFLRSKSMSRKDISPLLLMVRGRASGRCPRLSGPQSPHL